jgi:hypothetical protein
MLEVTMASFSATIDKTRSDQITNKFADLSWHLWDGKLNSW